MKQAKSIAFIGLAASLIVFAHYVGADDDGIMRAGNRGLVTTGQTAQSGSGDHGGAIGQPLVPRRIPQAQPHLEVAGSTARRVDTETTGCRLDFRGDNPSTRSLLIRLPRMICN